MTSYSTEARDVIEQIRSFYPDLHGRWEDHPDGFGFSLEYDEQPGLEFPTSVLFREDDTLQLEAPDFAAEYFPCGEAIVRERFVDSTCGLLDGRYRIVHIQTPTRLLKSQLQEPDGSGWKPRYTHHHSLLSLWPFWRTSQKVVQNVAAV